MSVLEVVYPFGLGPHRRKNKFTFRSKANWFHFLYGSHVLCSLLILLKENILPPKKGEIFTFFLLFTYFL
jgi:hypothetical protein